MVPIIILLIIVIVTIIHFLLIYIQKVILIIFLKILTIKLNTYSWSILSKSNHDSSFKSPSIYSYNTAFFAMFQAQNAIYPAILIMYIIRIMIHWRSS